jgi:hypothetical protein
MQMTHRQSIKSLHNRNHHQLSSTTGSIDAQHDDNWKQEFAQRCINRAKQSRRDQIAHQRRHQGSGRSGRIGTNHETPNNILNQITPSKFISGPHSGTDSNASLNLLQSDLKSRNTSSFNIANQTQQSDDVSSVSCRLASIFDDELQQTNSKHNQQQSSQFMNQNQQQSAHNRQQYQSSSLASQSMQLTDDEKQALLIEMERVLLETEAEHDAQLEFDTDCNAAQFDASLPSSQDCC